MLRKLLFGLFSLLVFFSVATVFTPSALAADDPTAEMVKDFCKRRQGNQMNLEIWYSGKCKDPKSIGFSQIVLLDLLTRLQGDAITDLTPQEVLLKLVTFDEKRNKVIAQLPSEPVAGKGLIGQLSNVIGAAYQSPPVSFANYLADIRQNIGNKSIVKPAYAQGTGFGFQNLLPILPIWRAFRNVAYFIFILVFILYGFMIMFRMKINPQNTASFQAAIPKIVTTLILITFAYAIAGFMIDLMYVVFNLILSVFASSGIINADNWWNSRVIQLASGQGGMIPSLLFSLANTFFFVPSSLINVFTQLPGAASLAIDVVLTVGGLGLILRIILLIAVGYSYFKLFFKLFEAYITIIIQVIFSPIILIQDVLPGSDAFGGWLRNITANLSVFPVSMVMFLLSYIFMVQPFTSQLGIGGASGLSGLTGVIPLQSSGSGFSMPLIGGPLAPVIGSWTNSESILAVIGFFIILMASKYVDMVRDALKVPPFKYGTALGEAMQMGWHQVGNQYSQFRQSKFGQATMGVVDSFGGRTVRQLTGGKVTSYKPSDVVSGAGDFIPTSKPH